jgi:FAD/FMN-containing dehydrogenase
MNDSLSKLARDWSAANKVPALFPDDYAAPSTNTVEGSVIADFRESPCIDYGKFIEKIPWFVLRPLDVSQLAACLLFLSEHRVPFKVRGSGHSSGGQVLTDSGAVVDVRHLNRIVKDEPDREQITVQGGHWWLQSVEYLHAQNRRPLVLTDNVRTSVAGTLAVGGFGDTTHLYGLQIQTVNAIRLMTLNGQEQILQPEDHLFRYVMAGRGQLGIITEATIQTMRRPPVLSARLLKWDTLDQFVPDALRIAETRCFEFFRTKIRWYYPPRLASIVAIAGNFTTDFGAADQAIQQLRPVEITKEEQLDFYQHSLHDPSEQWGHCSPSVEIVLPLPDGIRIWESIRTRIMRSGLALYLGRGSSVMILKIDQDKFPLAPFPSADYCLLIAIRPAMKRQEVGKFLPVLENIGATVLEARGKLYLMSIEIPVPNFAELQFGNALAEFRSLKAHLDPFGLLNPGLL